MHQKCQVTVPVFERRTFQLMALVSLAIGLFGCAAESLTSETKVNTALGSLATSAPVVVATQLPTVTEHPLARPLPLTFKDDALKTELADLELLPTFITYWTAYAKRDWTARYDMEQFQKEISRHFYMNYHHNAWWIDLLEVVRVHPVDNKGRVRVDISVLFKNPDRPTESTRQYLQDWWTSNGGDQWMHINADPVMNNLMPVI